MAQPTQNPAFAEYDIDALIEELRARCPVVIVGLSVPDNDDECETRMYTFGNRYAQIGMMDVIKARLMANVMGDLERESDDDDDE